MSRKQYRNGDPINGNCNSCIPVVINGVLCHEHFCPDAWRDEVRECKECGTKFHPEDRTQTCCCQHCVHSFYGDPCDSEDCQQQAEEFMESVGITEEG
jgi:hypothetical protein